MIHHMKAILKEKLYIVFKNVHNNHLNNTGDGGQAMHEEWVACL